MEKFIKLFKSGTGQNKGDILIPVAGIMEIKQESDTVINIFYAGNSTAQAGYAIGSDGSATVSAQTNVVQAIKITHDAIVSNSSSMKNWLNDAVEKSLQLSWQQPVYTPQGLPATAASYSVAVTITAVELGVKAAADVA